MNNRQSSKLLRTIQELEFAAVELNLYLDTHPEDEAAISAYNNIIHQYHEARRSYESQFGPLCNFGHTGPATTPWKWIEDPWPWEIEY